MNPFLFLFELVFDFAAVKERGQKMQAAMEEEARWRSSPISSFLPWPDLYCPLRPWPQVKEHLRATLFLLVYLNWFLGVPLLGA